MKNRMQCGRGSARAGLRGSVIVVVLVTLLLASMMLLKFMESSAVELTLATRQADRARLKTDAYAALETALAVMAEIKAVERTLHAPAQGWDDPYGYAGETPRDGVEVAFTFTDESGKASLPKITFDEMVLLAQALGLGESDARRFSDGLFAWMKADFTPTDIEAEASRYERDAIPHTPPLRSLRSWEELRSVRVAREYVYDETGALTPFGTALRENVSLYDFEGANVNALAPALAAARGWDANQTAAITGYREGTTARPAGAPAWFRSGEDLTAILGANADTNGIGAEAKLVRVEVLVKEGAASMRLSVLVGLDDNVALPPAANGTEAGEAANAEGNANLAGGAQSGRRGGRTGNAAGGETGNGAGASAERLDYPFVILEVVESAGPAPAAPVDEIEEPQT